MDMLGDRAACREPVKKEPFVRVKLSKEPKYKTPENKETDNTETCCKIDLAKEIDMQMNLTKNVEGRGIEFTDIDLNDGIQQNDFSNNSQDNENKDANVNVDDFYLDNPDWKLKSRN